jgi:FkbM family methyltransferase
MDRLTMIVERVRLEAGHLAARLSGAKARRRRAAFAGFDAALAALRPGDLAVDLGANVGLFTARMAATGADVVAFEPDPHAFAQLQARVGGLANVTLHQAAAGDRAGTVTLHRHRDFAAAPDRHSTSSSILGDKRGLGDQGVPVPLIDFPAWAAAQDRDIALIKIDIEGAEVALMEALLAHPVAGRIGRVFVETHERGLIALAPRTRALKARAAGMTAPRVNWDWH